MKKIKYTIVFILLVSILSAGYAFTPHRINPVDIRADGMGGTFLTDSESFYTLFSNPAGLAVSGDKTLFPPIMAMSNGGPLGEMFEMGIDAIELVIKKDLSLDNLSALTDMVTSLIGDTGFNLNTKASGPLTFGAIRNNFGWGFVNTISMSAQVPSLTKSDLNASMDLGLVLGYAVPFDFGIFGNLSVGFSGRIFSQMQATYTEGITDLLDNFDIEALPIYTTLGFGFDMAVQYEVLEFINVALAWQDVYTPTWTKKSKGYETIMDDLSTANAVYAAIKPKLGISVGVDIPFVEKLTGNIISALDVHIAYTDLLFAIEKDTKGVAYRNPVLELSLGTELVLFDVLALRVGLREMYPSAGIGLYLGNFKMDFAIFGRELGLEPGYSPQLNMGFSVAINY